MAKPKKKSKLKHTPKKVPVDNDKVDKSRKKRYMNTIGRVSASETNKRNTDKTETKKTKEEKLKRKRIAARKRLQDLKQNSEQYEAFKAKDRQRYYKKNSERKILAISEMTPRARKQIRKRKQINSKTYYEKKKQKNKLQELLRRYNLPDSDNNVILPSNRPEVNYPELNDPKDSTPSPRMLLRRHSDNRLGSDYAGPSSSKISRQHRTNYTQVAKSSLPDIITRKYKKHTKLQEPIVEFFPSRYLRRQSSCESLTSTARSGASSCNSGSSTGYNKAFRKYRYKKENEIVRLHKKLIESKKKEDIYRKRLNRIRKGIHRNSLSLIQKAITVKKPRTEIDTAKTDEKIKSMKNDIIKFFEDDENSRLCPGKKEFISKAKLKKQKRYLNDSIKNLFIKFRKSHNYLIHYATFCKFRPFWVLVPKVNNRDTCLCKLHSNMELLTAALKRNKIIKENNCTEILQSLCCDKENVKCLQRKCDNCKNKNIPYAEFDDLRPMVYWKWLKTTKMFIKNGKEMKSAVTEKKKIETNPRSVIKDFEEGIISFMPHCAKMINQSRAVKSIKENIQKDECVLHIDYSENYNAKYSEEIQAVYFGGSRQQITLHTAVLYYRDTQTYELKTQALCTLSSSLRHDAAAVWAHLDPLLRFIEEKFPCVKIIHMISDSPSSQYRNKTMFNIISKLHWQYKGLEHVTWNYTESGHGKGAPDGVGGVLKRTADQLVAYGKDIVNIHDLMRNLESSVQGVRIEVVKEYSIMEKELLISSQSKAFPGTMDVYQIIWNVKNKDQLTMRKLSCVDAVCLFNTVVCTHGNHLGFHEVEIKLDSSMIIKSKLPRVKNTKKPNINILSQVVIKPPHSENVVPTGHKQDREFLMPASKSILRSTKQDIIKTAGAVSQEHILKPIYCATVTRNVNSLPLTNTNDLYHKTMFGDGVLSQVATRKDVETIDLELQDEQQSIISDAPSFSQIETNDLDVNLTSINIEPLDEEETTSMPNFEQIDFEDMIPVSRTDTECSNKITGDPLHNKENECVINDALLNIENFEVVAGSWIIVEYETKDIKKHYIGQVIDINDNDFTVTFLKCVKKTTLVFSWPLKADIDEMVDIGSIKQVLQEPTKNRRDQLVFQNIDSRYNIH